MLKLLTILIAGMLFGFGLNISEMVNPKKILDFLDLTGTWDPSLMFVMIGAIVVTGLVNYLTKKQSKPILAELFHLPTKKDIDLKLITGATLFGIGWGLIGICPGPTIAATVYLIPEIFIFFASMLVGMIMHKWVAQKS